MQAPTLAFSCSSRPPSNKTFPPKTTLPLDSLPMVPSPHEVPSRWDGTASCHSHPQLHQQTEKKKNNKIHKIILTFQCEETEGESVDSLTAMQQEDHTQFLQVVGRTLHKMYPSSKENISMHRRKKQQKKVGISPFWYVAVTPR